MLIKISNQFPKVLNDVMHQSETGTNGRLPSYNVIRVDIYIVYTASREHDHQYFGLI